MNLPGPPGAMRRRAIAALEADLALTARQLHRYCGVRQGALTDLPYRDVTLYPAHGPHHVVQARVYGLDRRLIGEAHANRLGHLLGTACIRQRLGAAPETWSARPPYSPFEVPDAVMTSGGICTAIEYDTGSYARVRVSRKLAAFEVTYDAVCWGTPSQVRRGHMATHYPQLKLVDATWWEGREG